MKRLASLAMMCVLALGGLTFVGCHASGSVESTDTPHDSKTVTTEKPNGTKTTQTETKTYSNPNQ